MVNCELNTKTLKKRSCVVSTDSTKNGADCYYNAAKKGCYVKKNSKETNHAEEKTLKST